MKRTQVGALAGLGSGCLTLVVGPPAIAIVTTLVVLFTYEARWQRDIHPDVAGVASFAAGVVISLVLAAVVGGSVQWAVLKWMPDPDD